MSSILDDVTVDEYKGTSILDDVTKEDVPEDISDDSSPTPYELNREQIIQETFKEGKRLINETQQGISTIANRTKPDDSSQTQREKDMVYTGNVPETTELNQYLNTFDDDMRANYLSKTKNKPQYEKLDTARNMYEKRREVMSGESNIGKELIKGIQHLPANLKEGFSQLKKTIQYKVQDFMKPEELKRQEAEEGIFDPKNVQLTKAPKDEKRYENMDYLIADMHDKGELSDREIWDYYQQGAAREKKYARWTDKGLAPAIVGAVSYVNPITAITSIAAQYKSNRDEMENTQQAADALVLDLATYTAFVGAGRVWKYGKQKMIGSKIGEPLDDLVKNADRIKTRVSFEQYKDLKSKVDTGVATVAEQDALKYINEAIDYQFGSNASKTQILKNNTKLNLKVKIPEELVPEIKVEVKSKVKQPIKTVATKISPEDMIKKEIEIVKSEVKSAKGTGIRVKTETGEWIGIPSQRPKGLIGKQITKEKLSEEAKNRLEKGYGGYPADPDYLKAINKPQEANRAIDAWQEKIMDKDSYVETKDILKNVNIEGKPQEYIDAYNQMKERVDLYETYENKRIKVAEEAVAPIKETQEQKVFAKEVVSKEYPYLSKEETSAMAEVKRARIKTVSQLNKLEQKKVLKQKQKELEKIVDKNNSPVNEIKELTRERRAFIDLNSYETNLFLDPIEKNISLEQRELIPFLIEGTDIPEKLGRKDLIDKYNKYKNDPKIIKATKDIKKHFDEGWKFLQENTDSLEASQIEDYITHIWQISKKEKSEIVSWFSTRNKFLKKRYISTLKEGIERFGLKPAVLDVAEIVRIHDSMMHKVIANKRFVDQIKKINKDGIPLIERADKAPIDWKIIDNPALMQNVVIPGEAKLGEKISPELENVLAELGVAIGRRINPKAFGKPVSKQGSYTASKVPEIRLQRFFEDKTLTHEIGHYLDQKLNLGKEFHNKFKNELFEINKQRIKDLTAVGKERYAKSSSEQIAEFFAEFFSKPKEALKKAPGASTYVMDLLRKDGQLSKLVNFDFENKAKILIEEQMNTMIKLPVKVHPEIYDALNTVFGQRIYHPVIQAYEKINGYLKKASLSLSLFHHGALTETGIAVMGPIKTLKLANPINYIFNGMIKGDNYAFKKSEIARDAIKHGLQLGASNDIPVAKIQKSLNALAFKTKNKFLIGKLTGFLSSFNKKWDDALWSYLHDGLKLFGYEHLVSDYTKNIKTDIEITKIKRDIAQFVNDTYGGQQWDLLGVDPKTQQIMTWTLLSSDWTLSTIRQALSPTGVGKVYNSKLRKKLGSIFWIKAFLYYGVGINFLNYVLRKKDREENPEYYKGEKDGFWEKTMFNNTIGHQTHLFVGRHEDGTERYLRWGKQFRELPELFFDYGEFSPISAALKKVGGKTAPALQLASQVFTGYSPSGFKNKDIADTKGWERVWGISKTIAKSPLPFSTRTIFDDNKEFHLTDIAMPSSKGLSRYKAVELFKQAIEKQDKQMIKEVFAASQRNNLDGYSLFKTGLSVYKSEQTKKLKENINSLEDAKQKLKEAKSISEKKVYSRAAKQYMKENVYKKKILLLMDRAIKEMEYEK